MTKSIFDKGGTIALLLSIFSVVISYIFLNTRNTSVVNDGLRAPTVVVPPEKVNWMSSGKIQGTTGRYTPLVITGTDTIAVYGNYDDTNAFAGLYLRVGNWKTANTASVVVPNNKITDQSGLPFIRTSAVVRGESGKYYAVLHVGDNYPSSTGYIPAWATSDDGVNWVYHGKFVVDGVPTPYIYSSAANLIVQEDKLQVLDNVYPTNNRYLVWEDASTMVPSKKLILLYSADGKDWRFHRDPSGDIVDVWPTELSVDSNPMFPTAARTPFGYHLIAADNYPVNYHRHLFFCDGLKWRVLEYQAATYMPNIVNPKGTNLVYEPSTGLLHALTSGYHFQEQEHGFACP